MTNAEFVVHFQDSKQMTEYDFKLVSRTLKVNENTTIGEILTWYKMYDENTMDVKLTQLEKQ